MRPAASDIAERFARVCRDAPRRPLIHLPLVRTSVTAEALREAAAFHEARLAALGLGPGDLVVYGAGNRPELFALWLASRARGIVLMPVDAGTTPPEIAELVERFGARRAILNGGAGSIPGASAAEEYVKGLVAVTPAVDVVPRQYPGAAVLKLTSGSTGLPRATHTAETQLLHDVSHITEAMDIRPDDCQICALPLSHAYGIGNLVLPLLVQGTAIVLRESFVPHQIPNDAATYGARIFPGVPFMFDHFRDHLPPGSWPRGLDVLISAGARLELSTVLPFQRAFGVKIHSFYGTSETGGIAFDDSAGIADEGSVGRAMPGVMLALQPEESAPPDGGRVHVTGGAVASGYAGEQAGDDGFTGGGFLTGDYGRFSARGDLILTGRASAFINVAGRKVQPDEIESVLRQMPEIADVRVLGAADASRGQQIVAIIVARGTAPGLLAVRRFCAARLAPYKIPRAVIAVDRIPLTERGKTDRRQLDALAAGRLQPARDSGVL